MEIYKYLAEVYDRCMYDVDYYEWYKYLSVLLRENNVSGDILEMACGTGNITAFLARDYDVIAADVSEEMLAVAREKLMSCGLKARFAAADMNSFRRERKAGAVLSCMDGVNYLTEGPADFFECAFFNLCPGGVLLFDISSEYKLRNVINDGLFYDDSEDYTYLWTNEINDNLIFMNISMFVHESGSRYVRYDERHVQRIYSTEEIITELEKAGFTDIMVYDFLTHDIPGPESQRIQFTGRKRNE